MTPADLLEIKARLQAGGHATDPDIQAAIDALDWAAAEITRATAVADAWRSAATEISEFFYEAETLSRDVFLRATEKEAAQ